MIVSIVLVGFILIIFKLNVLGLILALVLIVLELDVFKTLIFNVLVVSELDVLYFFVGLILIIFKLDVFYLVDGLVLIFIELEVAHTIIHIIKLEFRLSRHLFVGRLGFLLSQSGLDDLWKDLGLGHVLLVGSIGKDLHLGGVFLLDELLGLACHLPVVFDLCIDFVEELFFLFGVFEGVCQ